MNVRKIAAPVHASHAPPETERLYVASPLQLYGTPRLDEAVQTLRALYPEAVLLLPAQLFRGRQDWLQRGQAILRECTRLVVVTDDEGWIGRGVWSEVATVLQLARPVAWCPRPGLLVPWGEVTWSPPDETNWTRYARLSRRGRA
jgi:hypothetical protein